MSKDLQQDVEQQVDGAMNEALERAPGPWRRLVDHATRTHALTLAAGLAFFGLISLAPAIGFAFGVLRLVLSDATVSGMTEALESSFPQTLGLADLIGHMENQAGGYAGLSLLVLLWPATTLASGWTRALDAVNEEDDSTGGGRGLRGRAKGLVLGGVLMLAFLALLAGVTASTAMAGEGRTALLGVTAVAAVGVQFGMCLAIYRWLPTHRHSLRSLWRGAAWATAGVVAATLAFAFALGFADQFAQRYPPALATAVVIGLWLYAANISLLLGEEYNALRRPAADEPAEDHGEE